MGATELEAMVVLVLTRADVEALLTLNDAITVTEQFVQEEAKGNNVHMAPFGGGHSGRPGASLTRFSLGGRMSNSIHMSVQCVLPGEIAEAHRHTAAAIRFVIQGVEGAHTVVEGEPMPMQTGDLVTTPAWTWHDHYNESSQPVIWLDVL